MTKLRIDMFNGTLEVEGDEDFVRSVYQDFKGQLLAIQQKQSSAKADAAATNAPASASTTMPTGLSANVSAAETTVAAGVQQDQPSRQQPRRRPRSNLSIIKEVNLEDPANDFSLQDFYAAKAPQTAMECNVLFVYYLQQIAGVERITVNHIYTCYKHMNIKYPNALKQSLADTSSRKHWLNTSSFEDIRLDTAGENYVEHDLPRIG